MPTCQVCGNKVSAFRSAGGILGPDSLWTCKSCIPQYRLQQKRAAMKLLCEDEPPRQLIRIPHVNQLAYGQHALLCGTLLVTEKGIVFAGVAPAPRVNPVGLVFGVLGALMSGLFGMRRRKRELAAAMDRMAKVPEDLAGTLEDAEQVTLIRTHHVTRLKFGWAAGLQVWTTSRSAWKAFVLLDKQQRWDEYRQGIEQAVLAGGGKV